MELDVHLLSEEAMQQEVDLKRLYVETIEGLVDADGSSTALPGNLRAAPRGL